jgi:hypothetical protein
MIGNPSSFAYNSIACISAGRGGTRDPRYSCTFLEISFSDIYYLLSNPCKTCFPPAFLANVGYISKVS